MSRAGMVAAHELGIQLPAFESLAEAEASLYAWRNDSLAALLSDATPSINLDYSPDSLKALERWVFDHGWVDKKQLAYSVPHAIGFYFGEVNCRHANFEWFVSEYAFLKGKFEIGIRRPLFQISLTRGLTPSLEKNKRMQSIWRMYHRYL